MKKYNKNNNELKVTVEEVVATSSEEVKEEFKQVATTITDATVKVLKYICKSEAIKAYRKRLGIANTAMINLLAEGGKPVRDAYLLNKKAKASVNGANLAATDITKADATEASADEAQLKAAEAIEALTDEQKEIYIKSLECYNRILSIMANVPDGDQLLVKAEHGVVHVSAVGFSKETKTVKISYDLKNQKMINISVSK